MHAGSQTVGGSLVKACGSLGAIKQGKQVHGNFLVSPYFDDDVVKSSLVDMYAKCGLPDDSRLVFDSIKLKNMASWTAIIYGYARKGRKEETLELFLRVHLKNLFAWTALISGLIQSGNGVDAFGLFVNMRRQGIIIIDPLVLSSIVGASPHLAMLEI
ncbi:pentatricopeptide repeat-containing protein At4g14050, mitochondrial-like [Gossypium raimondii]|uniref:pentatricopeptide repeat-containing protein At4g14050, mitochondrial-like n=1 Tax=Gossypium raimondii TaxID=29730 RepID=UPI00227C17C4|nr:pentatricopeptide repeat-containing protein At4g14050, mitochondrial-like [Gossypium raimondii]